MAQLWGGRFTKETDQLVYKMCIRDRSTAALYTVTLKMCRNKESYICRSFVQAFRKNFRQGTLIWLAYAGVGGILYFNLYAAATGKLFAQAFFLTVFTVMSILYVMIGIYLAPVLAKFDTTIIQILKISIFLCFRHIIRTILMMIVILIPYLDVYKRQHFCMMRKFK